jgi:sulfur-oxidizing protein SoxA
MRSPEAVLAASLALCVPCVSQAGAEQVRAAIAATLRSAHPTLGLAEFAAGSAAFDPARRAELDRNTPAPGASQALEEGKKLFTRKFRNGRSLAGCFPNGGRRIAAAYPQFDQKLKRVVTLETAVNQCLKTHGEPVLDPSDERTMGAVLAYVRALSDGQKLAVRVATPQAEERFAEGNRLFFTRMGQQNYACASCHLANAGRFFGDVALPAALGLGAQWPLFRAERAVSLQMRMRECLERMGAAPFAAGSDELAHLEYFLAYLANGVPLKTGAWRP